MKHKTVQTQLCTTTPILPTILIALIFDDDENYFPRSNLNVKTPENFDTLGSKPKNSDL